MNAPSAGFKLDLKNVLAVKTLLIIRGKIQVGPAALSFPNSATIEFGVITEISGLNDSPICRLVATGRPKNLHSKLSLATPHRCRDLTGCNFWHSSLVLHCSRQLQTHQRRLITTTGLLANLLS